VVGGAVGAGGAAGEGGVVPGVGAGGGASPPIGAELVGGPLVASAGLPPQATSVPARGMAAMPLRTRRRTAKFLLL